MGIAEMFIIGLLAVLVGGYIIILILDKMGKKGFFQ